MVMDPQIGIESAHFYSKKVGDLHYRGLLICNGQSTVFQVAALMAKEKVSCAFIGGSEGEIEGFVTDIILRDRVLAKNLKPGIAVREIMDTGIFHIEKNALLYEALLQMFQAKIRYLLVKEDNHFVGWISRNKILTEQYQGPFIFIQSLKQALDVEELKQKWRIVPLMVHQLVEKGIRASIINQIVSAVTDTITQRVIEIQFDQMGQAPANFVFIVLGSEGRGEQTLKTDQDNAIIYEDKANEKRELVRAYFLEFAEKVSTELNDIGIDFCKGDFMAKNPKWTHSLSHWKRNYENWIQQSTTETMMKYATFFDCRAIFGDYDLWEELKLFMGQQLLNPTEKFFMNLGWNALQYEPPLTFFKRNIKTFKIDGEEHFNIKKAMTPIVDLTRAFALKHRIFETNTGKRMEALRDLGIFSEKETKELSHAYYYLMSLRLEKQALQIIEKGQRPVNYVAINQLTKVQVVTLLEIFKVIKEFQLKIKIEFTKNIF
ncbi:putative signal-transduction protein containing cAMP-binding and CBS domains [Cecembia lonarensis LW9]|uniref:Putative signal-transduction protein containing cAMP-binding and CBS domains n=2 Tax=Cecembia TaxID=1187078 RepID=K1L2K7_CECL9|nr:putative signal-transduction protein containing cAMP-binding and CBS domains [Cecembia lonarensis LW9]